MSVRREVRAKVVELLTAAPALTGVEISPTPLGENHALEEAIWIERLTSRFDWRGMTGPAGYRANRREDLTVELAIDVYREAESQRDASAEAVNRAETLLQMIEETIAFTPDLGTVGAASALVRLSDIVARGRDVGWLAQGTCRIEISNYPAIP
jgi:hypothetical protein